MRFKCDFLAFFLANFSIPLVMDQAVLGIPAITALIPSPSCGRVVVVVVVVVVSEA